MPFSIADFYLYPFTATKCNHQNNSFSDLWVFLANHCISGDDLEGSWTQDYNPLPYLFWCSDSPIFDPKSKHCITFLYFLTIRSNENHLSREWHDQSHREHSLALPNVPLVYIISLDESLVDQHEKHSPSIRHTHNTTTNKKRKNILLLRAVPLYSYCPGCLQTPLEANIFQRTELHTKSGRACVLKPPASLSYNLGVRH